MNNEQINLPTLHENFSVISNHSCNCSSFAKLITHGIIWLQMNDSVAEWTAYSMYSYLLWLLQEVGQELISNQGTI